MDTSYPVSDKPVIVAPDCFLNCRAVPPTLETAVTLLNLGFPLSLSPSKTVEKPDMVWVINVFVTVPFQPSVQSTESSSLFSKNKFVAETVPPKNSTPSSEPLITAILRTVVPEPTP